MAEKFLENLIEIHSVEDVENNFLTWDQKLWSTIQETSTVIKRDPEVQKK